MRGQNERQDEGAERGRRAREVTGGGKHKETDKSAGSDEAAK